MKKRFLALTLIAALALSIGGCKKEENTTSNIVDKENIASTQTDATSAPMTADEVQEALDNFAKDADENADMKKIEGSTIKGDAVKGDLGGYEVSIGDAVLADGENSKVLVVEFEFKNNTSQTTKFSSVISANAFQDKTDLAPAVTFSSEGYEVLTVAQDVKYNETITVQKAYIVNDTSVPVTVEVMKHANYGGSQVLSKTFNLQ